MFKTLNKMCKSCLGIPEAVCFGACAVLTDGLPGRAGEPKRKRRAGRAGVMAATVEQKRRAEF